MLWCRRHHPHASHVLSVAADMPRLPADLALRMVQSLMRHRADIVIASDPRRSHPVVGLWPVDLAERLEADLKQTTIRSLHRWLSAFRVAQCAFPQGAFLNINTHEDLAQGHRSRPGREEKLASDFTEKVGYF
jgi:molybdopterin-guanine dinucleotide biosynthesis protein A